MTVEYRKLTSADLPHLIALIKIYEQEFEMQNFRMPDNNYLQSLLEKDNIIFYIAIADTTIVGGLTAHVLSSTYFQSAEVYIYDFAVTSFMQRKGIGKNLISAFKQYSKDSGFREMFVQADIEDQHALDFYIATGGMPAKVVHFTYKTEE